jgi:hypothetical protein
LEKVKKVDISYLTSSEGSVVFPPELTRLMPSEHALGVGIVNGKEYTFISQSFFLCWRALHLGVVSQCNKYIQILRGLNHYHAGLATGDPHSLHYFISKMVADAQLLSPDLLHDVVLFCSGASQRLLWSLTDCESPSAKSSRQWLVSKEDMPAAQCHLILSLPEHLVDDLMTLLLFVARTSSSVLCSAPLDSTLSLILFFLRRPWAGIP